MNDSPSLGQMPSIQPQAQAALSGGMTAYYNGIVSMKGNKQLEQEERNREQEMTQAKIHAEEVKFRKKGLELVDWEHKLTALEKELKKREKDLEGIGKAG